MAAGTTAEMSRSGLHMPVTMPAVFSGVRAAILVTIWDEYLAI